MGVKRPIKEQDEFKKILDPIQTNISVYHEGVRSNEKAQFICCNENCGVKFTKKINLVYDSLRNVPEANGCPICAKRIGGEKRHENFLAKYGSFLDNYPNLATEWDAEKNSIAPSQVSAGGGRHVNIWWICKECKHSWSAAPRDRVRGSGCPKCARKNGAYKRCRESIRSNEQLLNQYDKKHNGSLSSLKKTRREKIYWKCSFSDKHDFWLATTRDRLEKKSGCPTCAKSSISTIQIAIFNFLKSKFPELNPSLEHKLENYFLDIYLNNIDVAIEIDGFPWHDKPKAIERDRDKARICSERGILLLRLRDVRLNSGDSPYQTNVEIQNVKECLKIICKMLMDNVPQKHFCFIRAKKAYDEILLDGPLVGDWKTDNSIPCMFRPIPITHFGSIRSLISV